jgi:polar amino acid transport system substrate-binding protein
MSTAITLRRTLGGTLVASLLIGSLAACSSSGGKSGTDAQAASKPSAKGVSAVLVAANTSAPYLKATLHVPQVASIRAELPKKVLVSGKLAIGVGALPAGYPPLVFVGNDQKTITGSEPDLGRLVAAVFGLKPVITNATWENLFVGIDSGRTDVGFSNITDTEERKLKYDFASYRQDNLGFEVKKTSKWNFAGDYKNLADQTVAVATGTNQEKILVEWQKKLNSEGKKLEIKNFPDQNAVNLALSAGRITAYFGPNPGIQFHIAQDASSANATRSAGKWSGAGATLQGLIAATTKKGNGLAKPLQDAVNYLIKNGQYGTWLKSYNLSNEAVSSSELNPPGLPVSNS